MAIFDFVTGRKTKWVVVAAWLLLTMFAAMKAAGFEDAQNNETSSFLPGSAESYRALQIEETLPGGEQLPGVVVYRRESGLTIDDIDAIEADRRALIERGLDGQTGKPSIDYAPDRKMATLAVSVEAVGDDQRLLDAADRLNALAGSGPPGLVTKLTGGIGYSADASEIFGSLDGTLLIGTSTIVIVLLLLIYRSPLLWLLPIICVAFAETLARATGTLLAEAGMVVNGQSAGVMTVMVFGVGTDYALLLIARYREELRRHEDRHEAMRFALHRSVPAILASAATVAAALMMLMLADNNGAQSLGPTGALGVAAAMLAMLTALPALLLVTGRWVFYPRVPRFESEDHFAAGGFWTRLGEGVARRPRTVWIAMLMLMGAMALGWTSYSEGLKSTEAFRGDVDSVEGAKLLEKGLPPGVLAPTTVIVNNFEGPRQVAERRATMMLQNDPAVVEVDDVVVRGDDASKLTATLRLDPYSEEARDVIGRLRGTLAGLEGGDALIGGPTAIDRDARATAKRDNQVVIPVSLVIVLLILIALLRALLLPVLLIVTVVASFFASLGVSALVFDKVFGFPGSDPGLPLYVFIFLVALGVDYNIFLMARVREEALRTGTRDGMMRGLVATGGVITSAGVVLAGTFSILATLPLVFMTEIGFAVAFGVMFDALLIRSVLVPALVWDLGPRVWWPSALARARE